MNKERIKGIVVGFLLCALLSTSVMVMATPRTETRQITYGIQVNFNGQLVQFTDDNQPFVMGGRTFLPLRAIADLLDLSVGFDPDTNTAYLGNRTPTTPTPQPTPSPTPAPTTEPTPPPDASAQATIVGTWGWEHAGNFHPEFRFNADGSGVSFSEWGEELDDGRVIQHFFEEEMEWTMDNRIIVIEFADRVRKWYYTVSDNILELRSTTAIEWGWGGDLEYVTLTFVRKP